MEQVLGFNLLPLFEHVSVPDTWLIALNKHGEPDKLLRRLSAHQCADFGVSPDANTLKLMQLAEELQAPLIEAHFTKSITTKKKPSLAELWADKAVRPGIEAWLYRRLHQFYKLAHESHVVMCLDAARKPVLSHHLLRWPDASTESESVYGEPTLDLSRSDNALMYRLELRCASELVALSEVQLLNPGMPGWFIWKNTIWQLAGISGKMLIPFQSKEVVEVGKAHEAVWLRSFLKKNLDGTVEIRDSAFGITETEQLTEARLSITKHLFQEHWFLAMVFQYGDVSFYFGEKQASRTRIHIPDDAQSEVTIVRTKRNAASEQKVVEQLLSLGLIQEDQQFKLPEPHLSAIVQWLTQYSSKLEEQHIRFSLEYPGSGARILVETPEIKVETNSEQDWFDMQITVTIGSYQLPFRSLTTAIKKREREYFLPDGSLFLIPEAWFTRYHELAAYAEAEDSELETIRIYKAQKELLAVLEHDLIVQPNEVPFALPTTWCGESMLQAELRPYQKTGINWMVSGLAQGHGLCLADDMGLGKTLQTIAVLAHVKQARQSYLDTTAGQGSTRQLDLFAPPPVISQPLRALVIVPASLVFNWKAELTKFFPTAFVYTHIGPKRLTDSRAIAAHDVVIITYQINREDSDLLSKMDWQVLVLDESQNIKNRQAEMSKAVFRLSAPWRLALSGTPIENSLADLWSVMHYLNPGMLGGYTAFSRMYQSPIERDKNQEVKTRLRDKIQPYILRRRKQEVAPDLPSLTKQVHLVPMSEAQAELYEKSKSAARNELLGIRDIKEQRFAALAALLRLRQLASHPALAGEDKQIASGKFDFTLQLWQSVIDQGSKVLIFSSFEQHLLLYREWFEQQGIPFAWISGSTKVSDRKREVERFQTDPQVQTFFITLKAGGTGLNLTAAEYVFLLDPWWNPQAEEQAIARAHRIGQQQPVHAIRIITEGTIEEKIRLLQQNKEALSQDLIDDDLPVGITEMLELL